MARYAANTEVPASRSRDEIERTLTRYGATSFAYSANATSSAVAFEMKTPGGVRRVRFIIMLPDRNAKEFAYTANGYTRRSATAAAELYDRACRQVWRALLLVVKAKLEAVDAGISTFEEEFLAHIVLPDGTTVGDNIGPAIARAYAENTMPALMPGVNGRNE
jgi:hypothetical protein